MPLLVFQIFVALVVAGAAFMLMKGSGSNSQALRRIFFLLFVLVAGFSVFFPQAWTAVANFLGIGRGADLLLYLLVLTFFGFVATTFRKFSHQEDQITALARKVALLTAEKNIDDRDKNLD